MNSVDANQPAETVPIEVSKPATLEQCHRVIEELATQLSVLQQTVAVLSKKLALNSRNTSKRKRYLSGVLAR